MPQIDSVPQPQAERITAKEEIMRKIALLTAELRKTSEADESEHSPEDTDSVDFNAEMSASDLDKNPVVRNADPPGLSPSSIFDHDGINQVINSSIILNVLKLIDFWNPGSVFRQSQSGVFGSMLQSWSE